MRQLGEEPIGYRPRGVVHYARIDSRLLRNRHPLSRRAVLGDGGVRRGEGLLHQLQIHQTSYLELLVEIDVALRRFFTEIGGKPGKEVGDDSREARRT